MFRKIVVSIVNFIFKILFRVKIKGEENLSKNENYIICANHSHYFDGPFLASMYKKDAYIIAKKELFKNKILSFIFTKLGAISVDRQNNDFAVLKRSIRLLKEKPLIIFPEGTRNKGLKPLPAFPGISIIARRANSIIQPVSIVTNYKFFSKIIMIYHKPIDLKEYNIENYTQQDYSFISNDIMDKIYKKINEVKNENSIS